MLGAVNYAKGPKSGILAYHLNNSKEPYTRDSSVGLLAC